MTREDAIKEINKVFVPAYANYIVTALTEGATVSDKEPTTKNDLGIDDEERELALMYLEQIKDDYIEGVGYERYPLPEYYAIETAMKSLALPSVIPQEQKWIPVTERLPEEGQFIIVSYPYDASDCSRKRVMTAWYHKEYGFTCGIADAWMPLPQPYKEESEET